MYFEYEPMAIKGKKGDFLLATPLRVIIILWRDKN